MLGGKLEHVEEVSASTKTSLTPLCALVKQFVCENSPIEVNHKPPFCQQKWVQGLAPC